MEVRISRVIDHVHQHPPRFAFRRHGLIDACVVGGGDSEPDTVEPFRRKFACAVLDASCCDQRLQRIIEFRSTHSNLRAGFKQGGDFPRRHRAASDHEDNAVAQINEHGKQGGGHSLAVQSIWRS